MDLIIFLVLLVLGYGFGRYLEKRHYQSIFRREAQYRDLVLIASKILPENLPPSDTVLVKGSVVISVDHFKRFLATLRNLMGGRVKSYESLLDRARREAILRLKEEAHGLGANFVFNFKFETSSISKGNRSNNIGSIEVLAYGTALIPRVRQV